MWVVGTHFIEPSLLLPALTGSQSLEPDLGTEPRYTDDGCWVYEFALRPFPLNLEIKIQPQFPFQVRTCLAKLHGELHGRIQTEVW